MEKQKIRSRHFRYIITQYVQWLTIENYQPKTIEAYPQALIEFFLFLERNNINHIRRIEQEHLTHFKNHLLVRLNKKSTYSGIQNVTINGIIKGVNCFVRHLNTNNEGVQLDIYEDYLPVNTHKKVVLTQAEVMALYNATFETSREGSIPMGQRDRVMIAIFYGCGIRLNEGRNLNISDVDFQNKRILVRHGKGNKERYVPVPNKHLADILSYIQHGREWFRYEHYSTTVNKRPVQKSIPKADEQALFLGVFGTRMKTFYQRLNLLKQRTGITKNIGTHTLRHSVATHLLQGGWKLEQVSTFLGHSNIDSTQIYTRIVEELKRE